MYVARLRLTDYRNHASSDVALSPGINVFLGPNGQGKTNAVEAVNFLATGGSHRTHLSHAVVRSGVTSAVINADLVNDTRQLNVDVHIESAGSNRARANGNVIRLKELSRFVHVVLFAPEDLRLIRDDPDVRRNFIDSVVEVLSPRMIAVAADYERVLKQRNSLLKSIRAISKSQRDYSTLDLWDEKLISLGTEIMCARFAAVSALREPLRAAYVDIAGEDHNAHISVSTKVGAEFDESTPRDEIFKTLATALAAKRDDDVERGQSQVGPHRDDILFELNALPVKGYASHGETWSFALALKLAAAELFRHDELGDPIVILDDVFAELDEARRNRLAVAIAGFEQVLITAAVRADIPEMNVVSEFSVVAGEVTP